MTEKYIPKDDIPNLYGLLGLTEDVCKDENCDSIVHKAYINKAKHCHPDKNPDRPEAAELFELLTMAYDILKDNINRSEYNNHLSLNKQSLNDFNKLKKNATEHMLAAGQYVEPNDDHKMSFSEKMRMLDIKHGYDKSVDSAMDANLAKRKLNDLSQQRTTQEKELAHERLFEGETFNNKKFQAVFDKVHNRDDDSSVALYNGVPSAWNAPGTVANYGAFDNLDSVYVDDSNRVDTDRQVYGSIKYTGPTKKLTREEIENIAEAEYVDNHNHLDEKYCADIKSKLRQRSSENNTFDKRSLSDYKKDDMSAYGIFDKIGIKCLDKLGFNDNDDISKKYDKLMAERASLS